MANSIQKITKSDQKIALSSVKVLSEREQQAIRSNSKIIKLRIQESEETVAIPLKALKLLTSIISNMAEGKSMALMATDTEVTTQQAAEILNVSHPYIIKLLEKGEIPFKKIGSHRRILLQDILDYESKLKIRRRTKLNSLAKEAQKLNLGYS